MKIGKDSVATLAYTLTADDNRTIIEIIRKDHPKAFLFGYNILLEGFESEMMNKKAGDSFDFTLSPEKAYGTKDPYAIIDIPKDSFEVDGVIDEKIMIIGNKIPMRDNYGNEHIGIVLEIKKEDVVIDFNHPLAGKIIRFHGEVIDVRAAKQEELDSLNNTGGCGSGCGCGSGEKSKAKDHECNPEREAAGECCNGDDSICGCKSESSAKAEEDDCSVCGNPPEDQGKGIGDCQCI